MAANNYYGFTHAGTQYGTEYTATTQYANASQPFGTQATGQTPGAAYPVPTQSYAISGYARPANQTGAGGVMATRSSSTSYPTAYAATTAGATAYPGFTQPQQQATGSTKTASAPSFTNYDAAVYSAVSAFASGAGGVSSGSRGAGFSKRGGGPGQMHRKGPRMPKPQTLHYCDVCKISCAGPQTYKEHLEGQKHKKKEILLKAGGTQTVPKGSPVGLRCELCDVTCTGSDAYAAHLRGSKHQKVLKLHTKLGKPIPADNPTVIPPASGPSPSAQKKPAVVKAANSFVKPAAPTKINFVSGKTEFDRFLHTDPLAKKETSSTSSDTLCTTYPASAVGTDVPANETSSSAAAESSDVGESNTQSYVEETVEPVGMEYIEEIRTEDGKGMTFNCKLCDCKFNDPNAKEMHMKGRRHRLQYKKKVDPSLHVDLKMNRQSKLEERRSRNRRGFQEPNHMGPPMPPLMSHGGHPRFGMMPPGMYHPRPSPPNPMFYIPPLIRRTETMDDRHIMAKHAEIYPREEELQAIQRIVSGTEKALKFVSDEIAETDAKKVNGETPAVVVKTDNENGVEPAESEKAETKLSAANLQAHRILKGVMRVGNLAKGLLLRGDNTVQLVVLCSAKPTVRLLNRVFESLPKQLQAVAPEEQYSISRHLEESGLSVTAVSGPAIEVKVTFTSPLVRASTGGEATATTVKEPDDADDLLDKEKCLDALAALRHAKWFQARATVLHSCVIIIRILRDICNRIPEWKCLSPWVVELLAEKAISTAGIPVSPGDALRIVFEVVSSGLFITPFGPGLLDPCEKDCIDALGSLTRQQRVDVTHFGQYALRALTFGKLYQVLGMEELPKFKKDGHGGRKRRRNDGVEAGEGEEAIAADGKKDKKEGEESMEEVGGSYNTGENGTEQVHEGES